MSDRSSTVAARHASTRRHLRFGPIGLPS